MKVSSYDSYTEEYSKAKKQYNYQTEGDEEDEDEDGLHQEQQYANHKMINDLYKNYTNEQDDESQTYHEESEGVLDYFHNRQQTELNEDDDYLQDGDEENGTDQQEEEKEVTDYDYLQQKLENDEDEVEIDLEQYQGYSDQGFENDRELYKNSSDIQHSGRKKLYQSPQKQTIQSECNQEQEVASAPHLATLESKRIKSNKKKVQGNVVQAAKKDCQFCDWNIRRIRFLRENLHIRYFEAFNFYFAKPINEILANYALPHVITLKDFSYYYDENEYLKRYYRVDEVPPRLAVLTNFFTNSYKQTRPNLIVTNSHRVIQKRNFKQARLFMRQVAKNVNNGIGYNANNNLYNKDDSSESEAYSSNQNNESNQGGTSSKGKQKKTNLPSKVLNSHLSQTIPLSQNQSNQTGEQSYSQDAHDYDNYRNFIMQMSFETSTHDIYYPSFSTSRKDKTETQSDQKLSNAQDKNRYNFKKENKKDLNKNEQDEEDFKNNVDDDEDGGIISELAIDINTEFLPPGIASYFEKREFQRLEKNLSSKNKKGSKEENEGDGINPRLLELIVGSEQVYDQDKLENKKKQQIVQEKKDNLQNINSIIEQMQQQYQSNYLNLLDLDTHHSTNLEGGTQNAIGNGDTANNYDPSKRVSTLISQTNSTQSHFNTFNANNYIIGTNSQRSIMPVTSNPKANPQKQFDKQNLAELHLGSNIVQHVTSLNTEGRNSEISMQPIFRDGFNFSNPIYQNELQRYSNTQLPLQLQDLSSNTYQYQNLQSLIQSQEDLNKADHQGVKQIDSKKKQNSSQKSIQQVQQYILSQIKKQHDFINLGRNQATLSTQNSQHPFYTSLSPEQKDKKNQGSSQQKGSKSSKGNYPQPKEFDDGKGKSINNQYNATSTTSSNRKLLNERNFTEVNLGSVFEKLKLSNRLASLESKQKNQINESNNLETFIQKIANNSLSRNNSTKKKKNHQNGALTARTNQVSSNDVSPIGYTPRNFAKKNSTQKVDPSTSLKYLHTEQSPDQIRKMSHMTNNLVQNQIGDKKNSLSHNQLNSNSSMKKIGNTSKVKEQGSLDNCVMSGRVSVSPSQYPYKNYQQTSSTTVPKSLNTITQQMTTTLDHSSPGNNSVVNSIFKDSINVKPTNNVNKRISSISNIRNKIISAGEQKSQLNSPSRICTDRESQNPRLKQNKSPSLNTHGGVQKISQKKASYKRGSNAKIYSPNSHSYQKQQPNSMLSNNYYQRGEDQGSTSQLNPNNSLNILNNNWNVSNQMQQQTQQSESSSSNLQLQLLQQIQQNLIAATSNTNNTSSSHVPPHHGSVPQIQQMHLLNGATSLTSSQTAAALANQKNPQNKTISQKILTNALTNTINKFYKNIIKNIETEGQRDSLSSPTTQQVNNQKAASSSQQNRNQNTISPSQVHQIQQQQQLQSTAENDLSPRLTPQSIQNYQKPNQKKQANTALLRQQGRTKVGQSEEIAQKLIKSLCKQRVKQKDSIGSSNQMSLNIETLNSARTSSQNKVQEYRVNSQNGNYGTSQAIMQSPAVSQAISDSKKKQLLMRQKGSNGAQNNIGMTSLNGLISNQSINSSVNNINPQINSVNYQTNNTNTNNGNNIQSNLNSNNKTNNQKSINPSNYNSKNNNINVNNINPMSNSYVGNGSANNQIIYNNPQLPNQQQQHQQYLISQQQQTQVQNQGIQEPKEAHHTRIDSIKKVNSPRQSQPLIKPPQIISQIGNHSQIALPKQTDYRAVKTEAPLLTEESQQQIIASFKNILNQNMLNSGLIQQNNYQYQQGQVDQFNIAPLASSNQKQPQQTNNNYNNNLTQNNNSQTNVGIQNKNYQSTNQQTKSSIGNTLSPGRVTDTKKKSVKKEDSQPYGNQQQQQFQLLTSLASVKKAQEEFQLGNGFYTQRNTGKTRKKSNEYVGSNQKYIQSSRGSYQGHYADLSAWKHASITNQNGQQQQQLSQQNLNVAAQIPNQKEKAQNQQYNTMLNTSPIRQTQTQQQQQYVQSGNYLINPNQNQANISPQLTQQQTAGLLNHKIKQLSQKFQMQ